MHLSLGNFARLIVVWSEAHPRPMPWKESTDPYKIWLSEIILQQTQVSQGLPYYLAFVRRFPTVRHLAKASENEVLRMWQGLGYNSRARNLLATARDIVQRQGGVFPSAYAQIRALKGIGDYTAAAIASFAFGHPTPVLDSNVIRVLSRVKGIDGDPSKRKTRAELYALLGEMIRREDPAEFNQAIMNFGAMQCTPRKPDCTACMLSRHCVAFQDGLVDDLPVRKTKPAKRIRFFHYFIVYDHYGIIMHQRSEKDIWQQMYDFPMIETPKKGLPPKTSRDVFLKKLGTKPPLRIKRVQEKSQTLTHQEICCAFYEVPGNKLNNKKLPPEYRLVHFENLVTFAMPKVIRAFLLDNCYI